MAKRAAAGKRAATRGAAKKSVGRKAAKRKAATRAAATRAKGRTPTPKPSRVAKAAAVVRGAAKGAVAAVRRRLSAKDQNDPIVMLETDHRRFEDLLKQGEATTERAVKRRTQLLTTLTSELYLHEALEEKILYPALKPHDQARESVLEGYQEHHIADVIVKELLELARDDERWGAKFKVLKENIEHHIAEEERQMFRTARAVLSRDELRGLAASMKALKAELEGG